LIEFIEQQLEPFCEEYPDIYSVNQKFYEFDPPYQEELVMLGFMKSIQIRINIDFAEHRFVRKLLLLKFTQDPRYNDYLKWIKECRGTGQLFSSFII
jgi:hypothetical protein